VIEPVAAFHGASLTAPRSDRHVTGNGCGPGGVDRHPGPHSAPSITDQRETQTWRQRVS
jgi:hypothetical protein